MGFWRWVLLWICFGAVLDVSVFGALWLVLFGCLVCFEWLIVCLVRHGVRVASVDWLGLGWLVFQTRVRVRVRLDLKKVVSKVHYVERNRCPPFFDICEAKVRPPKAGRQNIKAASPPVLSCEKLGKQVFLFPASMSTPNSFSGLLGFEGSLPRDQTIPCKKVFIPFYISEANQKQVGALPVKC